MRKLAIMSICLNALIMILFAVSAKWDELIGLIVILSAFIPSILLAIKVLESTSRYASGEIKNVRFPDSIK